MMKFFRINIFFLCLFFLFSIFYFLDSNVNADTTSLTITVIQPSVPSSCGDHSCNGSESCSSCPTDCGACPSSGGGGGGGGGGGYVAPVTSAVFSGRAYPKSTITFLKDAQIAATTIADANANFQVSVSGISGGNYIFSVYSENNKGIRSALLTFPISVASGATTKVGGIFIAPTIAVDKSEVKRGDNIAIFGQSAPDSAITISVSSEEEFFRKVQADQNGAYLYNFDTALLDIGQHFAKSKAAYVTEVSSFSKAIGFMVGTKNIIAELPKVIEKSDLNNDKRVNLIDFSIAAYWYKRPSLSASADLNGDGKVDLIDFSIMAFYWTG
ncbi:dockerin type I repeat-containing protein [Patescibacteria group bacterium]|nr:dockerin type I repeat-containing protein [Patescibacteria group bacterium]